MKLYWFLLLGLLIVPLALAADNYKPYLHKASIPEHPAVKLFGEYQSSLFSGAGTYSFPFIVPKGVNSLQPSLALQYNSLSMNQRPSMEGAGWSLTTDYISRNINFTTENVANDRFMLTMDGNTHELVYSSADRLWHTSIETYWKIENLSNGGNQYGMYWLVTQKDGTQYRFGYNTDSELGSNTGKGYAVRWSVDNVIDTFGNQMNFVYLENPFADDLGAVYLANISYNSRHLDFSYEGSTRPDQRRMYEQGQLISESKRLTDISVYADSLVRRYHLSYSVLAPGMSSLTNITELGADNQSQRYGIIFSYALSNPGFNKVTTNYPPPVLFSDANTDFGVRLVDVNNDGFADVLKNDAVSLENKTWLNNKTGNWTYDSSWIIPEDMVVTSDRIDNGIRFTDVNRDGFVDILQARDTILKVWLNNGHGWSLSSWTIPTMFINNLYQDQGVREADVNGDGLTDLVKARNTFARVVYLNNGTGWKSSADWTVPTDFVLSGGGDIGTRFVDVNGDGLPDLSQSYANDTGTTRQTWLNNGTGWVNTTLFYPPVYYSVFGTRNDTGARFVDVNGDGLVDIWEGIDNGTVASHAWLNNGTGWVGNDSWASPEPFVKLEKNIGRRIADVNGDGFPDVVISHQDTSMMYTWVKNYSVPYLLTGIVNEYGGVTSINYTTSTRFNHSSNGNSSLGFNIFVVYNVSTQNGLNNSLGVLSVTSYNYSFGNYDYDRQEMRGFGTVVENKQSGSVWHYFLQDKARKGKEYKTDVPGMFTSVNEYVGVVSDIGIYNVTLHSTSSYRYDGNESPFITNVTYNYDQFGNVLSVASLGDINVTGDERYTNYTYAADKSDWILDKVSSSRGYDNAYTKVRESKMYYDGLGLNGITRGALTKKEDWNNDGNNSFTYFDYDTFGNVIRQKDSLGNAMTTSFDSSHTYPATSVNALGHVITDSFDVGTGNLLTETKNGITTTYQYDTFGRVIKEIRPYDSTSLPTKKYNYSMDGAAPEVVKVSLKTTSNKTNDISYYYDGYANLVQLKTDVENDQQIVKNIFYDGLGRVKAEQNPYFAAFTPNLTVVSSDVNTTYNYDILDRVIGISNADGTSKNITFDRKNITDFDENKNRHRYTLDGYDRIAKVYEFYVDNVINVNDTFVTSYDYDTNDNLVTITDNVGNVFSFTYDSLNRKTKMDDPDLGRWDYVYDQNGNLIVQNDSKNQKITMAYDALNRVLTKTSSDVTTTFGYDQDLQGTLTNVTKNDPITGQNVLYKYEYDDRLRPIKETKTVNSVSFETNFIYDSQDRMISKEGLSELDFIFNKQGKVKQIPGFISDSSYNPFGSLLNRTYNNNLVQTFTLNTTNNRLVSISIPNVQSLSYTYDSVGNILTINDAINNRLHTMTYDSLDRLSKAIVGPDRFVYSYNSIGNIMKIVKNNESKKFMYNGTVAHAPSKIFQGSAGVDVYHVTEISNNSKNRTVEFYLVNDWNASVTNANWTVDFGDGNITSAVGLTLAAESATKITTSRNYTYGGKYPIIVTAQSPNSTDVEIKQSVFGLKANALRSLFSNASQRIFEFEVGKNINETIYSASWNCTEGITSTILVSLSGNQSMYDYLHINFTSPGTKTFNCTATSNDNRESKALSVNIPGLEVEDYDILSENVSSRVVAFNAKNNYWDTNTTISVDTESNSFSNTFRIRKDQSVMVFTEVNYTSDSNKTFAITLNGGTNVVKNFGNTFSMHGATIENYSRVENKTHEQFTFQVRNNWKSGNVVVTMTNPAYSNTSFINYNQTLKYTVVTNFTSQGQKTPQITAQVSSFTDKVNDLFKLKPIEINEMNTLAENQLNSVTELIVKNNLNQSQIFSWILNTGQSNLTSSQNISINTSNIFVYIASNYTSTGVFRTKAIVNSSQFSDNQSGVVVT